MQKLICPQCAADIPAENIDIQNTTAQCPACGYDFDFSSIVSDKPKQSKKKIAPADTSNKLKVFDRADGSTEIIRSWRNPTAYFLMFWCLIWDTASFAGFFGVLANGDWQDLLFISMFVIIGVSISYWTLLMLVNRTSIHIDTDQITVKSTPILFHFPRYFNVSDIDNLTIKQTGYEVNGSHLFDIFTDTPDGERKKLVGGFENYADAVFIQQEIRKHTYADAYDDTPYLDTHFS